MLDDKHRDGWSDRWRLYITSCYEGKDAYYNKGPAGTCRAHMQYISDSDWCFLAIPEFALLQSDSSQVHFRASVAE